jgi:hypothetical protein
VFAHLSSLRTFAHRLLAGSRGFGHFLGRPLARL